VNLKEKLENPFPHAIISQEIWRYGTCLSKGFGNICTELYTSGGERARSVDLGNSANICKTLYLCTYEERQFRTTGNDPFMELHALLFIFNYVTSSIVLFSLVQWSYYRVSQLGGEEVEEEECYDLLPLIAWEVLIL
jgi:hypothetical protein